MKEMVCYPLKKTTILLVLLVLLSAAVLMPYSVKADLNPNPFTAKPDKTFFLSGIDSSITVSGRTSVAASTVSFQLYDESNSPIGQSFSTTSANYVYSKTQSFGLLSYGRYYIVASESASNTNVKFWFTYCQTTNWTPAVFPIQTTFQGITYSLFTDRTLLVSKGGDWLSVTFPSIQQTTDLTQTSTVNSMAYRYHLSKSGIVDLDLAFVLAHNGLKFYLSGTQNIPRSFTIQIDSSRPLQRFLDAVKCGNLVFDFSDFSSSGLTFTYSNKILTVQAGTTFFLDPTVFSDGFDDGTFNAYSGTTITSGDTCIVQAASAHHGSSYGMLSSVNNIDADNAYAYKTLTAASTLYMSAYVRFNTLPTSGGDTAPIMGLFTDTTPLGQIMISGGGYWKMRSGDTTVQSYTGIVPATGVWYPIKLKVVASATVGECHFYLNNIERLSITGINIGGTSMDTAKIGAHSRNSAGVNHAISMDADCVYVSTTDILPEPSNDGCTFTNLDDTNNIYAQKKNYVLTANTSDIAGYASISTVDATIQTGAGTERVTFRYNGGTNAFSKLSGATTVWTLVTGSCVATRSGNVTNLAFYFYPRFNATEESDLDVKLVTTDSASVAITTTYDLNVDVVSHLTITGFASSPTEYINPSTSVTYSGTVYYVNNPASSTASSSYPPDAQFTSVIVHDAAHTTKGTDTTIVNGAFSLSFTSDASVGQDTYHPYINMADSGYTDADVSGITDTLTVDQVQVQSYTVSDARADVSANVNVDVHLHYASDASAVTDGTTTINSVSASNQGSGNWRATVTSAAVAAVTYNTVAAAGNTRAITSVDQNSKTTTVVWDRMKVTGYVANVSRTDVSKAVYVNVTVVYEYDNASVTTGTLTINGVSATGLGSGIYRVLPSQSSPQLVTYNTVAGSESTYGLTVVNQNSQSLPVVWDRLTVQYKAVDDSRRDVDTSGSVRFKLWSEYDHAYVTSGSVSINGSVATWDGTNQWWGLTVSQSSVSKKWYIVSAVNWDLYNITALNSGVSSNSSSIIWDRMMVQAIARSDDRTDIGSTVQVNVTVNYEYDNVSVTSGSLTINGVSSTHLGSGVYRIQPAQSSVQQVVYNTVAGSESTYGLSAVNQNGKSTSVIWDKVQLDSMDSDQAEVPAGTTIHVHATAKLAYDGHVVGSSFDNVTINGYHFTWNSGTGKWTYNFTYTSGTTLNLNSLTSALDAGYGITFPDSNGQGLSLKWSTGGTGPSGGPGGSYVIPPLPQLPPITLPPLEIPKATVDLGTAFIIVAIISVSVFSVIRSRRITLAGSWEAKRKNKPRLDKDWEKKRKKRMK